MYYDLCINYENVNHKDKEKFHQLCELVTSAICDNFTLIALNVNKRGTLTTNDENISSPLDLNLIYQKYSVKFLNSMSHTLINWDQIRQLSRVTVEVNDSKDLYQFSNPSNAIRSYDIVAVCPQSDKMLDLCLADLNVDVITINFDVKFNFLGKKHLLNSSIDKGTFFEINYSRFISDTSKRSTFITNFLIFLEVTKGKNIILSSGAETFYDHRSPHDITTMFETIFQIKKDIIKHMISDNVEKVITKSVQRKYFKTVMNITEIPNTTCVTTTSHMTIEENIDK